MLNVVDTTDFFPFSIILSLKLFFDCLLLFVIADAYVFFSLA
jgi:hypothetical protein